MPIFAVEELKAVVEHFFVEVFVYDGMERDKSQVWTRHEKNRRTTAPLISHHLQRPSRQINTHTETDRQTDNRWTDGASLLDVLCVGSLFWLSK